MTPTDAARPRGRVVVTGASGYVGSSLVPRLVAAGWAVTALARNAPAARLEVPVLDLDLADDAAAELSSRFEQAHAVIHLAGPSEVVAAVDPDTALRDTILSASHVGQAAKDAGVPRVVYLSTVHVYGGRANDDRPLSESLRPDPRSVYAVSRLASEHVLATLLGPDTLVVLRMSNAVGAPTRPDLDRWTLVTNDLSRQAVVSGRMTLRTPGLQGRDFVALADVCEVLEASMDPHQVPGGTYNLASGLAVSIRSLAELVQDEVERQTGQRPELIAPDPEGQQASTFDVDVGRLASLGLAPSTPLADAVAETVAFCVAHRDILAETGAST